MRIDESSDWGVFRYRWLNILYVLLLIFLGLIVIVDWLLGLVG